MHVIMKIQNFFFLVLSFVGCTFKTSSQSVSDRGYSVMLNGLLSHSVNEVSVGDVDPGPEVIFLDAREKNEFDVSHIKNAVFVGYDNFDPNNVKEIPKEKQVVVYCSVGYRSEKISEKLIELGYTNVSNLYGGIFEWKNAGKPVYDPEGNETEKVHAYDKLWGRWLKAGKKCYNK